MSSTTRFATGKPTDYNWDAILDLDRIIPCVEGGKVLERTSPRAGQGRDQGEDGRDVDDVQGHRRGRRARRGRARARCCAIKSKDTGGPGYANADVAFALDDGGGTIHTAAQISGKAASMGEGVVATVLDALIKDFTQKLAAI